MPTAEGTANRKETDGPGRPQPAARGRSGCKTVIRQEQMGEEFHRGGADVLKKRETWKLNTGLYCAWVFFVLGTGIYVSHWEVMPWQLIGRFWMLLAGVAALCPLLMKKVRGWQPRVHRLGSCLSLWAFRVLCFGCSLAVLGCCFLAVKPGGFDGDPGTQLRQALSGQYNDYLPVVHTLLAFRLPLTLTGGWIPSVILFQILLFHIIIIGIL